MSTDPKPWEPGFDIKEWLRQDENRCRSDGWPHIYSQSVEDLHAAMLGRIRELEAFEVLVNRIADEGPLSSPQTKRNWALEARRLILGIK